MSKVVGKVVDILRGRSQPPKRTSVRPTVSKHYDGSRMNTQLDELNSRNHAQRMTTHAGMREEYIETGKVAFTKIILQKDKIVQILQRCKETLWDQLGTFIKFDKDRRLESSKDIQLLATHFQLLKSRYFRFQDVTHHNCIENYRHLIESIQTIIDKIGKQLSAKEKGKIYVHDEEDFCQFMKMVFGKPSKLFNKKYVRVVTQELWHYFFFQEKTHDKIVESLRLWAHGIYLPFNPAKIKLHLAVLRGDKVFLEKACALKLRSPIYCHINEADSLGMTPLMLAVYSFKDAILPTLFMLGASPFVVPLTRMENPEGNYANIVSYLEKRGLSQHNKMNIKYPSYQRYYKNLIEETKDTNQLRLLANILGLEYAKRYYTIGASEDLVSRLENMKDCSFQIAWKLVSKFSLIGTPPNDVITVYKRGSNVRIDFNMTNLFTNRMKPEKGRYSFLFKQKPEKLFVYIDQNKKVIRNLYGQTDLSDIEQKAEMFVKQGDVENQYIIQCAGEEHITKSQCGKTGKKLKYTVYYEYQNVKRAQHAEFKDPSEYQDQLYKANIVNYTKMSESLRQYAIKECIGETAKVQRKKNQNKMVMEALTLPNFDITLQNIHAILELVANHSDHLMKLEKFVRLQKELFESGKKSIYHEFPGVMSFELSLGVSLVVEIRNFNFNTPKHEIFEVSAKMQDQNHFNVDNRPNDELGRLHQRTFSIDSSINESFTRYLNPLDKNEQKQFEQARRKYEQIMASTIDTEFIDLLNNCKEVNFKKKQ